MNLNKLKIVKNQIIGVLISISLLQACVSGKQLTKPQAEMIGRPKVEAVQELDKKYKIELNTVLDNLKRQFQELNDIVEMISCLDSIKEGYNRLKLMIRFYDLEKVILDNIYRLPIAVTSDLIKQLDTIRKNFRLAAKEEIEDMQKDLNKK